MLKIYRAVTSNSGYEAINQSPRQTDSAPFIEFMLGVIRDTLIAHTPHVERLLDVLSRYDAPMNRVQLQTGLGLKDRKSFRERYLQPALAAGLIEMTLPDKPRSRLQAYRLTSKGCLQP